MITKKQVCKPVTSFNFIKLIKVGSGTMHNILMRFAYHHNLTLATAKCPNYGYFTREVSRALTYPLPWVSNANKFDIIVDHTVFNKNASLEIIHNDAVFISLVRYPFTAAFTIYNHYNGEKELSVSFEKFLLDPQKHEKLFVLRSGCSDGTKYSVTRNFNALLMGFKNQSGKVDEFMPHLMMLDKEIDHVGITEDYDVSLVLLKNKMCWKMKDILYLKIHESDHSKKAINGKDKMAQLLVNHQKWSNLDYLQYNFFLEKHKREVNEQNSMFHTEVEQFTKYNAQFKYFCGSMKQIFQNVTVKDISLIKHLIYSNRLQIDDDFVSFEDCIISQFSERRAKRPVLYRQYPGVCNKNPQLAKSLYLKCDEQFHVIPGIHVDTVYYILGLH